MCCGGFGEVRVGLVEFFEAEEVFPAGGTARGFGGEEIGVGDGGGGGGGWGFGGLW